MRAALLLLTLALLAPHAAAHVEPYSAAQSLRVGDWHVLLDARPGAPYAGQPFAWTVHVGEGAAQMPAEDVTVALTVAAGPAAVNASWRLAPSATAGYHVANATLPQPGSYNLSIQVESPGRVAVGAATFSVYRDVGATIQPENPALDVEANRTQEIVFLVLDRAQKRVDLFPDLRIRIEHWDDGHRTLLHETERDLERKEAGRHVLTYDFPWEGMYHLTFASAAGGFSWEDTPVLHLTALRGVRFDDDDKDTPGVTALALAAASIGAALAFRRRS